MMSQLLSPVGKDSSNVAQALIKLFAVSKCTIIMLHYFVLLVVM